MLTKINGAIFTDLIENGVRNVEKHRRVLNDLNVFPVPDGDTGTNMAMTLKNGRDTIQGNAASLSEIAQQFAAAAVFGARGNSGVIVSQFFKGLADGFQNQYEADCALLANALSCGYQAAYAAVSKPVEGTILTVLKDASLALNHALPLNSIHEAIDIYLNAARVSLQNTPQLLPVLKKAGVVDSGGSGIVYFFEGIQKCLNGEKIEMEEEAAIPTGDMPPIDLSIFNKETDFSFGYCIEGLLQLKTDTDDFDQKAFKVALSKIGESVVSTLEGDKVKLHIHSPKIGRVMDYCQKFGEFLTLKIENMTVQNMQQEQNKPKAQKFLFAEQPYPSSFAVIAVATNSVMQQKFFDMGADVVIMSEIAPSAQDFMDAFQHTAGKEILVFPNSSNSILTSMQAGSLYKGAKVTVLNSRSLAECYASLSVMDFDGSIDEAISLANDTISHLYQASVYHAAKDVTYGSKHIPQNGFFALANKDLLHIGETLEDVMLETLEGVLKKRSYDVITLFYGKNVAEEYVEYITDKIMDLGFEIEIAAVPTQETIYCFTIAFE